MLKHADAYVMFFSANFYAGQEYAVGYATCQSPLGPCEDAPENPVPVTVTPGGLAWPTVAVPYESEVSVGAA